MAGAGGDEFAAAAAHEAAPPEREPGMEEKPFTDFFFLSPKALSSLPRVFLAHRDCLSPLAAPSSLPHQPRKMG